MEPGLQKESEKMNICFFCKGETKEQLTKFVVDLGACVLIVKDVPGRVCTQCGETTYSDEVMQNLEKIVAAIKDSLVSEVAIVEYSKAA